MSESSHFCKDLVDYLAAGVTPFHAVEETARRLDAAGFRPLDEREPWRLEPGGRYRVQRNDSSLVAFVIGRTAPETSGLRLVGAHTDSPCLRLKPEPVLPGSGCLRLGVEVYGGVLLNPWFDRDLSVAGRLHTIDEDGTIRSRLLDLRRPVATVPSLAIHLDREANEKRSVNPQKHLPAVLAIGCEGDPPPAFRDLLQTWFRAAYPEADRERILDFELSLYDTQPPALFGLEQAFLASARLDNLVSCHACTWALLEAGGGPTAVMVLNDHEEVGSQSAIGAQGPFLTQVLERILPDPEARSRALARSVLVSADNAHAEHPNHPDRHDLAHAPRIGRGPVLKVNANQRYASNSWTQALFRRLAELEGVPLQTFVTRTDLACGSTVGPLTAAQTGIATLDVGVPQWAMHSIRETCAAVDPERLARVLRRFLDCEEPARPE